MIEIPDLTAPAAPAPGALVGLRGRVRQNPLLLVGGTMVVLILLVAVFAPLLAPYPADAGSATHPFMVLRPPSSLHWFGTDQVGRDVLSRVIYGARVSPLIAMVTLRMLGGSRAARASASSSAGKARKMSVTRMITSSSQPPK